MEWCDKTLAEVNVSLWNIHELRLTPNSKEWEELSFDPFPNNSKYAYFLEASDFAWVRPNPLIQMMVETNDVLHTFGPLAFIMDVPKTNPSLDHTHAHHKHGRISMGYNLAMTVIKCSEKQLYDYEVKAKMELIEFCTPEGTPTDRFEHPRPPYARTTICQRVHFNDDQIFHMAVMVCKGPETGISASSSHMTLMIPSTMLSTILPNTP